jgi:hypothetical protein
MLIVEMYIRTLEYASTHAYACMDCRLLACLVKG